MKFNEETKTWKVSIRSMFTAPRDHVLIHWDFAQGESWIVAYLANEPHMKGSLHHGDMHKDTAANAIYKVPHEEVTDLMRYMGKQANHAFAYRMGYKRGAELINEKSVDPPYVTVTLTEMKRIRDSWLEYYSAIQSWWRAIEDKLGRDRILITPYGRKRVFFEAWGNELFKQGTASLPQSTLADHANGKLHPVLKIPGGFQEVFNQFVVQKPLIKIVNQAHDSMVAEVHKDIVDDVLDPITALLQRPMEIEGEVFTIPVDREIGEREGELDKLERLPIAA